MTIIWLDGTIWRLFSEYTIILYRAFLSFFLSLYVRVCLRENVLRTSVKSYSLDFPEVIILNGVTQLVEVLRCNPEGRGFDSRWCH